MLHNNHLNHIQDYLDWKKILIFGIALRIFFFLFTCFIPFPYGPSPPVSPLYYQTGVDLAEYLERIELFTTIEGYRNLVNVYYELIVLGEHPKIRPVGPIYPLLLRLFDYGPENTFSFSFFIFFIEASAFSIWCISQKKLVNGFTGLLFALMPHVIWFSVLISTDIFSYFFSTILFALLFSSNNYSRYIPLLSLLIIFTRPTGIIMCLIVLFARENIFNSIKEHITIKFIVFFIMVFGLFYYTPYFLVDQHLIDADPEWTKIARTNGLFIPLFTKFIAIFGFHASENGLVVAEIVRSLYGILFLTGFLIIIWERSFLIIPFFNEKIFNFFIIAYFYIFFF